MAVPHLNSGERMEMFRRLFLINRSFHFIVQHISELENAKKLSAQHFEELRGITQEVQLHVNNRLMEEMHTVERADWYNYGTIRSDMQERLDPSRK